MKPFVNILTLSLLIWIRATLAPAATTPECSFSPKNTDLFPLTNLSPLEAFKEHELVFYGKVLVEGKNCSKGFCSGIKVEKVLKGSDLPPITVVTQPLQASKCPSLNLGKNDVWLFFGKMATTNRGTPYVELNAKAPHFTTEAVADIETLQGRYLLYQAKLDQAVERAMKKKMWEK